MPVTEITSPEQWTAHLASLPASALLVVLFHAPWAAPCAQMRTVIDALAAEYSSESESTSAPTSTPESTSATSWVSLNAEELSDISEEYDVSAVPYVVLLRGGKVVESISGSSAPKVRAAVERHVLSSTSHPVVPAPAPETAAPETTPQIATSTSTKTPKEELFARLGTLVKASPVMLFMKGTPSAPECGFSRQMVALLRERAVRYGFFNILADDDVRQGLKEYADWPTFPQLWVDGELVGGLDIVKEEIAADPKFLERYSVSTAA